MVVDVSDVSRLVEARRAGVAPDHEHRLVARVLEPVVVVLRHEHDLAGAELDVGIAHARDTVARHEVLELLRVRMPVDVVLRPRREHGDPEDRVLGAYRLAGEEPPHIHVHPAVLCAQGSIGWGCLEPLLERMLVYAPDRLGHPLTSGGSLGVHEYFTLSGGMARMTQITTAVLTSRVPYCLT